MQDNNHKEIQNTKNNYSNCKINKKILKKFLTLILIIFSYIFIELIFRYIPSPKISIFLPIYNKAKYLNRSISSIQKQTLKEIEIIPVNDFSDDNSLEILKKMAAKDSRIKIINNKRNKGLLYSRAMGILHSKGKYLMNLDPDDRLEGPDNLEYLYNKAYLTKVDIVSFAFLKENNFKFIKNINCQHYDKILVQPQIIQEYYKLNDLLITNKLVKKELLFKAFKKFKKKIYGEKWNYGEDEIWSSLVNKHANSMICVNKVIFIYYSNNDSLMHKRYNSLYFSNIINWLEMFTIIFEKKNNSIYLNKLVSRLNQIIGRKENFLLILKNNTQIKNKYINILNKVITNYNIDNIIINKIIFSIKSI